MSRRWGDGSRGAIGGRTLNIRHSTLNIEGKRPHDESAMGRWKPGRGLRQNIEHSTFNTQH